MTTNNLVIDPDARRVFVAGTEIKLTATEFNLLRELFNNKGIAMTFEHLSNSVWGYEVGRESIYAYVERLRRKIEPDAKNPRYIVTLPRVGYRFDGD